MNLAIIPCIFGSDFSTLWTLRWSENIDASQHNYVLGVIVKTLDLRLYIALKLRYSNFNLYLKTVVAILFIISMR